jgi:hypothetical protein
MIVGNQLQKINLVEGNLKVPGTSRQRNRKAESGYGISINRFQLKEGF